jgi:NTE family protein
VILLNKKINAVFEGGGVRGIGHVGAACVFEEKGYEFINLAGSSAGAIVASLLAVGYQCDEIQEEMKTLNYAKFKQKTLLHHLGTVGKIISIFGYYGIYSADYFENWLNNLLEKKGKVTFGDIKTKDKECQNAMYKLQVTASDLTDKRLLILPNDLKDFCINPDIFPIAKAVRMSMSIPIFYEPYKIRDCNGKVHLIVDGGLLSNYPMGILDDGRSNPKCPTIGFKFVDNSNETQKTNSNHSNMNVFEYIMSLATTALNANDKQYISYSKGDFQRTVAIPTTVTVNDKEQSIGATDFDISRVEIDSLFNNGAKAAMKFLNTWDFEQWKKTYRKTSD